MTPVYLILAACLSASAYALALVGAGFASVALLRRIPPAASRACRPAIDASTAFSLGLGLYASVWILLGLTGWLRLWIVLVLLAAGFFYGAWSVAKSWRAGLARWDREPITDRLAAAELLTAAGLAALLAVLVFASLRSPFGDSVAFYLAWPKVIAASGTIAPLPQYEGMSSIWMTAEAHFAALMLLGGEHAVKLFVGISLLAAVHAAWMLAAECGCSRRGRLLVALALATSTAVINVTVDGKTDLVAVAPGLSAVLWALRLGRDPEQNRSPVLTGLLAGTAAGAKLTYVVALGAALATLVVMAAIASPGPNRNRLRAAVGWSATIALAAALIALPQIIKNEVLFSQPLLPFLGAGREVWFSPDVVRRILLTLPFALTFGGYWAQHGNLSPLVIGLLPLLLLYGWQTNPARALLRRLMVATVFGLAAWFVLLPSQLAPRYFLAPLLLLAIPAGWAGEQAWGGDRKLLSHAVVVFALLTTGLTTAEMVRSHAAVSWEYMKKASLSSDACAPVIWPDAHCQIAEIINRELKPGDRLLFVSYYRYHLRPDILQCLIPFALSMTVDAEMVRTNGMDYVLLEKGNEIGRPFPMELVEVLHEDAWFAFYKVKDAFRGRGAKCVEERRGYWRVRKVDLGRAETRDKGA